MRATIIARTTSGSTYVMSFDNLGVRWVRVPHDSLMHVSTGQLEIVPRVVPGERLMLGALRSTPVKEVAFLGTGPTPSDNPEAWASARRGAFSSMREPASA
jgi:hypothetical protein